MARLRFGPHLRAVCAHLQISPQLLEHTQMPELRAIVQARVPLARARRALPSPSNLPLRTPSFRLADDLILCSKCLESAITLRWLNSRFPCDSRRTSEHPPVCPFLLMMIPRAATM